MVLGMVVEGGNVAGKNAEIKAKKGLGRGLTEWQLFKAGLELLGEFNSAVATTSRIPEDEICTSQLLPTSTRRRCL